MNAGFLLVMMPLRAGIGMMMTTCGMPVSLLLSCLIRVHIHTMLYEICCAYDCVA